MIENFDEVAKQLSQLASIVNAFKSEAVQLRLVELIFQNTGNSEPERTTDESIDSTVHRRRKKAVLKPPKEKNTANPRRSAGNSGRPGPGAIIDKLISSGFFKQAKTVNDIIAHCKSKFAHSYSTGELSTSLGRALRGDKLERDKNKDLQFEYKQK